MASPAEKGCMRKLNTTKLRMFAVNVNWFVSFVSHPGMPAAYDLSTVIGSGPSVSHNNLIPLGTNFNSHWLLNMSWSLCGGEQIGKRQRKSAVQLGSCRHAWKQLLFEQLCFWSVFSTAALYDMEKNEKTGLLGWIFSHHKTKNILKDYRRLPNDIQCCESVFPLPGFFYFCVFVTLKCFRSSN